MSQHLFRMDHPKYGHLEVMAGWDRPLQGFFMSIELLDAPEDEDNCYLYSNLDDENLPIGGFARSFDYFLPILQRLEINLPAEMIADIESDGRANMGNKQRNWRATA